MITDGLDSTNIHTNVTQNFLMWFRWGFLQNMFFFLVTCCCCSITIVSNTATNDTDYIAAPMFYNTGCIMLLWGLAGLAWIITGAVLRWRTAGKICSGTANIPSVEVPGLLLKSGAFLHMWSILSLIFYTCLCCIITPFSVLTVILAYTNES